jgi:hypothetical protein
MNNAPFHNGIWESMIIAATNSSPAFYYYSGSGIEVPKTTSRVKIDSSIKEIPDRALYRCRNLVEAEIPEGIHIIGDEAFSWCCALTHISVPSTVTVIGTWAFGYCSELLSLELSFGLKVIGDQALRGCKSLKKVIVPSTVIRIGKEAFASCSELISVELSEGLKEIGDSAFAGCCNLKNIALPSTVNTIGKHAFYKWMLRFQRLSHGQDDNRLLDALRGRFDGLPVHRICYYQAHHITATTQERLRHAFLKSGPSGFKTDEFGMTPLHLLAISAKPNIRLFEAILKEYPENLITKDRWGNFPVHYTCDGNAPTEIIRLLLDKHRSVVPTDSINWKRLIMLAYENCSNESTKCVIRSSIETRLSFLGLQSWKLDVCAAVDEISEGQNFVAFRALMERIQSKLLWYEFKEALSLVELALWKAKINDSLTFMGAKKDRIHRKNCRILCGDHIVISNVLSFLGNPSNAPR